jgi:hypothetical protein
MTGDKNNPENNDHMPDNEPITDAALAGNSDFTSTMDASEWRTNPAFDDVALESLAAPSTSQYALTEHAIGDIPTDSRKIATAERRAYGNANAIESPELVQELGARRYSAFSTIAPGPAGTVYPGPAILVLGADRSRVRTVLANANINGVLIVGPFDQVSTGNGFPIGPGVTFETTTTEEVYVCNPQSADNADRYLGIWAEYA